MHDINLGSADQSQFCRRVNPLQIQLYTTWGLDQDTVKRINSHLWEEKCAICLQLLDKQQQILKTTFLTSEEVAKEQEILAKPTWQRAVKDLQNIYADQGDYFIQRIMLTPGIGAKVYSTAERFVKKAFEKTDRAMLPISENLQTLRSQIREIPRNLQFISCPQWREESFSKLTNYHLVQSFFGGEPSLFEEHFNDCEACKINKLIIIRDHFPHLEEIDNLVHQEVAESRAEAEVLVIKMLLKGLHQELNQAEPIIKGQLSNLDLAAIPAIMARSSIEKPPPVSENNFAPSAKTTIKSPTTKSPKATATRKPAPLPELPGFWGQLLIWLLASIVTGTMLFAAINLILRRGK
jgi:hypothetical protein